MKIEQFIDAPFTIVFNPDRLLADVAVVASVSKDNLVLSVGKKKAHIFALENTGQVAARTIELVSSEGTGSVMIDKDVFSQVVKGRKSDISMTFDGSEMKIKAMRGTFKASIKTVPVVNEKLDQINQILSVALKTEKSELDQTQQEQLWGTVENAAISDVMYGTELNRFVDSSGGVLKVSSYDQLHMALCKTKIKGLPPFRMALNDGYVAHLKKIMGDSGVQLVMNSNFFMAMSEKGLLYMQPRQVQDSTWGVVASMLEQKNKYPITMKTSGGRMLTILENLCAVYEQSATVECNATAKGLAMKISTSYGSVSDTMPCEEIEGSGTFNVEPTTLQNLLTLLPASDVVTIQIKPGDHYRITCPTSGSEYLGSLHSSD